MKKLCVVLVSMLFMLTSCEVFEDIGELFGDDDTPCPTLEGEAVPAPVFEGFQSTYNDSTEVLLWCDGGDRGFYAIFLRDSTEEVFAIFDAQGNFVSEEVDRDDDDDQHEEEGACECELSDDDDDDD